MAAARHAGYSLCFASDPEGFRPQPITFCLQPGGYHSCRYIQLSMTIHYRIVCRIRIKNKKPLISTRGSHSHLFSGALWHERKEREPPIRRAIFNRCPGEGLLLFHNRMPQTHVFLLSLIFCSFHAPKIDTLSIADCYYTPSCIFSTSNISSFSYSLDPSFIAA